MTEHEGDINHLDAEGFTPLMKCTKLGVNAVRLCLNRGANVNHSITDKKLTALHFALGHPYPVSKPAALVTLNMVPVVEVLLEAGANVCPDWDYYIHTLPR